jgi:hypothetical protein
MEFVRIKPDRSSDSMGFFYRTDLVGDIGEPDPPDAPDILDVVLKAQIAASPRATITLDWLAVPENDVDEGDELYKLPLVVKTEPAIASVLSDWRADFLKRTGFTEPTTTLGKKLGVVQQTIREVDGERQLRGFDDKGELVDFRILLPDAE